MIETKGPIGVRLAADIGGTFTDVAAFDEKSGALRLGKVLSTPAKLVDGVLEGVTEAKVDLADAGLFFHGSTVVINTLLERTGARTALLTTKGFRDIYEIGRINRPNSFNLFHKKHEPLVERRLRFEVTERMRADGTVHTPLDMDNVKAICDQLEGLEVEAVAILFLHSYRNADHEKRVKDYVAQRFPQMFVTASHELSQEYREFERTSTTAANAYVGRTIRKYIGELESQLQEKKFDGELFIVKSSGGLYTAEEAQSKCIWMLESGPAAGVVGAKALCDELGLKDAIALDMGGTTAKAGVIRDGRTLTTSMGMIGGYLRGLPVQISMIDISEVGTGGGSLARVGPGGSLRVGPQSAGASPGPACYDLGGTQPTVTDANLLLGRLAADRFLGGEMKLNVEAARKAMATHICEPLKLSEADAAEGILRIAVNSMANAVKAVTSERGLDPGPVRHPVRLWRRRSAACHGGRARARHPPGADPGRAGALRGRRHAAHRCASRPDALGVRGAVQAVVREHRTELRGHGGRGHRADQAVGRAGARRSWCIVRSTCATSARSMRRRSSCRSNCSATRTRPACASCSTRATSGSTATRRTKATPRSSACAARRRASCPSRRCRRSRAATKSRPPRPRPDRARCTSVSPAASSTARPTRAPNF